MAAYYDISARYAFVGGVYMVTYGKLGKIDVGLMLCDLSDISDFSGLSDLSDFEWH